MDKVKILFVCLGNICRSPLAEGIFKHKINERGLENFVEAASCGTANYHIGRAPDSRTIANAKKNGIQLNHLGRQLQHTDLGQYDFIFAMDANNHQNILLLQDAHHHKHKVTRMRDFDPITKGDVPDPYYGKEHDFQEVFDILNRTMDNFIDHLEKQVNSENA